MADIIEMPKLSDTMSTGTLVKWLKKEGDTVATGDMLAEVETDKATMELESFFDGTLIKIFAPEGAEVAIGAGLCAIGKPGEEVEAPAAAAPAKTEEAPKEEAKQEAPPAEPAPAATPAPKAESTPTPAPAPEAVADTGERLRISPLAKKMAEEKGINPRSIKGTGPSGRIVRADVLAAEKAGPAASAASSALIGSGAKKGPIQEARVTKVSNMRATIAKRLVESKSTVPHFYLDIEIDASPLLTLRQQLNANLADQGVRLSVNDFILKASAEALRKVPDVNASWENGSVRYYAEAHVSFAVAIDDGLITPVIKDTHEKSVFAVSSEAKVLAKAAKGKKLKPDQFTGGTFCVSNLGMMGIPSFKAIINPPNAAILAVGTTVEKPVVVNGQITIGQRMILTLSVDHRVVDGAVGASFLNALKQLLEAPALLLL